MYKLFASFLKKPFVYQLQKIRRKLIKCGCASTYVCMCVQTAALIFPLPREHCYIWDASMLTPK